MDGFWALPGACEYCQRRKTEFECNNCYLLGMFHCVRCSTKQRPLCPSCTQYMDTDSEEDDALSTTTDGSAADTLSFTISSQASCNTDSDCTLSMSGVSGKAAQSAPPSFDAQNCLLPESYVLGQRGRAIHQAELITGTRLYPASQQHPVVREKRNHPTRNVDIVMIRYVPMEVGVRNEVRPQTSSFLLWLTSDHVVSSKAPNTRYFQRRPAVEVQINHVLRSSLGAVRVVKLEKTTQESAVVEIELEDVGSTFYTASGIHAPFVQVYGVDAPTIGGDTVILLEYKRHYRFKEIFLLGPDLAGEREALKRVGCSADVASHSTQVPSGAVFELGPAKMFVRPDQAHAVILALINFQRAKRRLRAGDVIVSIEKRAKVLMLAQRIVRQSDASPQQLSLDISEYRRVFDRDDSEIFSSVTASTTDIHLSRACNPRRCRAKAM